MDKILKKILKKILTFIDFIGVIITLKEFFIDHDYSAGVIVGIISIVLGIVIQILDNTIIFSTYIQELFGFDSMNNLQKPFIFSNIGFLFIDIFILHLSFTIYDDTPLVMMNMCGFPIILSVVVLIFNSLDNNISKMLWIYISVCIISRIIFFIYFFVIQLSMEISFGNIFEMIGCIILNVPSIVPCIFVCEICLKIDKT